jgi:quinol monooxygenase YgiN
MGPPMELTIFARFHAMDGQADAVAAAIREVVAATSQEPGCREIRPYRSTRDPRLFYIHSRWTDEAAFDLHAELPHTVKFLATVEALIDHAFDINRARMLD